MGSPSINTYAQIIEVLTKQKQNLAANTAAVGATLADVTEVTNTVNNLNAMLTFCQQAEAYKEEIFGIKELMFNGVPGTAIPAFPTAPTAPTLTAPLAGALTLTRNRNRRFKAAPGYTDPIGVALGIGKSDEDDPVLTAPTISVTASEMGYEFAVVVSNRQQSDAWEVFVRPVGTTAFKSIGTRTGKSSDFVYAAGTLSSGDESTPIQIDVMVQLKKNNADYGPPSAKSTVTVNP